MIKIKDYPTLIQDWDKKKKKSLKNTLKEIGALQYKMLAQRKNSLLIVFQGLDASGKDGLTNRLLKYCNPVGIAVKSFKKPTDEEFAHDFLWRVHKHTPGKGSVQIFIRSHYEDILVPSVEGYYTPEMIDERYGLTNDFERLIKHNGTTILKFFLNVSKEEQEKRLRERLVNPEKYWKHNDGDWETRKKFDRYMEVYEEIINRCNEVPWHIVPADKNSHKLYYVSNVVLDALQNMDLQWPRLKTEMKF
jgi:PPK2 family polyphosphate:nucleotide phosphotransferase